MARTKKITKAQIDELLKLYDALGYVVPDDLGTWTMAQGDRELGELIHEEANKLAALEAEVTVASVASHKDRDTQAFTQMLKHKYDDSDKPQITMWHTPEQEKAMTETLAQRQAAVADIQKTVQATLPPPVMPVVDIKATYSNIKISDVTLGLPRTYPPSLVGVNFLVEKVRFVTAPADTYHTEPFDSAEALIFIPNPEGTKEYSILDIGGKKALLTTLHDIADAQKTAPDELFLMTIRETQSKVGRTYYDMRLATMNGTSGTSEDFAF